MTPPGALLSLAEAAEAVNPGLDRATFRRLADRLGIAYHRLGRQRYYSAEAIADLIERTRTCPVSDADPASTSGVDAGSSAGQKADARASAAQARQIAERLKARSRRSSPNAASAPPASVVKLRT